MLNEQINKICNYKHFEPYNRFNCQFNKMDSILYKHVFIRLRQKLHVVVIRSDTKLHQHGLNNIKPTDVFMVKRLYFQTQF